VSFAEVCTLLSAILVITVRLCCAVGEANRQGDEAEAAAAAAAASQHPKQKDDTTAAAQQVQPQTQPSSVATPSPVSTFDFGGNVVNTVL